jgi:O-antigen/teichoic acid export membrane protein
LFELIKTMMSRGGAALGAILFHIAVIRVLDVAAAGQLFLWLTTLYVASFVANLGLDTYLLKRISARTSKFAPAKKRLAFLFSSALAIVVVLGASASGKWIFMALPFFALVAINSRIMRAVGRYVSAGVIEVSAISALAFVLLCVCVWINGAIEIDGVACVFVVAATCLFLLSELLVGKSHRIWAGLGVKWLHLDRASLPFVVFPLLIFATQWLPVYFLARTSDESVSIFNIAVRFSSLVTFVSISIDSYLSPRFSRLHEQGSYLQIKAVVSKFRGYSAVACVVFLWMYFLGGPLLITSWAGEAYADAYYVAIPVLLMYFFMLMGGPYQSFLLMSDQESLVNKVNVLALVLVLLCCACFAYLDALTEVAAAIALLFGRGVAALLMLVKGAAYINQRCALIRSAGDH